MMEPDLESQFFNLQLTVQKLEEELLLYRNGTTTQELMDFISEKEHEIGLLRNSISSKDESLRKIMKSSAELLGKYNTIAEENTFLKDALQRLQTQQGEGEQYISRIRQLEEHNQSLQDERDLVENNTCNLRAIIQENEETIRRLNDTISAAYDSIVKLHARCADLVSEKSAQSQKLDSDRQEMLSQVLKFKESISSSLLQRDDMIKKQSDLIAKMNAQITNMQRELESKNQIIEAAPEAAAAAAAASESTAVETRRLASLQDENGQLKAKVGALEGVVHELEKAVKKMKGGLKDRGSVNITGPHNGIPLDSKSKDAPAHTGGGGHKKVPHSKDVVPYLDMENAVSKDLEPPTTREHSSHTSNNHHHHHHHHSQKSTSLLSGGYQTMTTPSQPPQAAVGLQLYRSSHIGQDNIHPGVFSKADKPDRGKPLTRIL